MEIQKIANTTKVDLSSAQKSANNANDTKTKGLFSDENQKVTASFETQTSEKTVYEGGFNIFGFNLFGKKYTEKTSVDDNNNTVVQRFDKKGDLVKTTTTDESGNMLIQEGSNELVFMPNSKAGADIYYPHAEPDGSTSYVKATYDKGEKYASSSGFNENGGVASYLKATNVAIHMKDAGLRIGGLPEAAQKLLGAK